MRWANALDTLVIALLLLVAAIVGSGGFHVTLAGWRVSATSIWRPAAIAFGLLVLRHIAIPRPAIHNRVRSAASAAFGTTGRIVRQVARWPWRRVVVAVPYVAAFALFVGSVVRDYDTATGFTYLLGFGRSADARKIPALNDVPHYVQSDAAGYDGQFYAQLAVEPSLRDPALRTALDAPSYRARRILFPWIAYVVGFGQPQWALQAYAVENLVAWMLTAWLLTRWFPPGRLRTFLAWFACLFSHGSVISVQRAVPDGASMLLIALGIAAVEGGRLSLATMILAISGLGREANLLATAMLGSTDRRAVFSLRRALGSVCLVLLPLAVWTGYVRYAFGSPGGVGTGNLTLPFAGYVDKWQATIGDLWENGWGWYGRFSLYALVSLTVEAGYLVWRVDWRNVWWRVGIGYAALLVVLGGSVWAGYPGAVTRVVLPLTFAFNVLVIEERAWFWPLLLLGNLTVLHGLQALDVPYLSNHL
jgi:hypothetical protein